MSWTPWRREGIRFECECRRLPTHGSALPPMLSVVVFGVVCELDDDDPYAPIFRYDPAPAPEESRGSRPNCGPCAGHRTDPAAIPWAVRICGGGEADPELAAPVGEGPGAATAVRRHQLHRVRRPQRRPARHPPQRPRFQLEFESLTGPLAWARHGELGPRGTRLSRR